MDINHLTTLIMLARKGIAGVSETLTVDQAKTGWLAIEASEQQVQEVQNKFQEAQKAQSEESQPEDQKDTP